ncbi:MAG: DNA repair protein RadC [Chloroflexi bacterium]|nr:DNA repair protein RadC [Chloroflexota bacterium]
MIRDMPQGERPRERLKAYGVSALNNTELLAILLRTGVRGESVVGMASRLLARFQGLEGLARANLSELCEMHGVSEAKASQVLAALELGRRMLSLSPQERPVVTSPQDVANLVAAEMGLLEQEHLRVVLLNTRNQVMGISEIYVGNVLSAVVRPAEVFRPAIRENHPSIIVVHNHPSGDPAPSRDDVAITKDLVEAGRLLDIELLDHIVVGKGNRFVSMKEKALGFG